MYSVCLFGTSFISGVSAVQDNSQDLHTFNLSYKDDGFSLRVHIRIEGSEIAFKKEPDFGEHEIVYGALPTGREKKDYLCFALDATDKRLYLDLNRNLDLTDDPAGIFVGFDRKNHANSWRLMTFKNIHLDVPGSLTSLQYRIDLRFNKVGKQITLSATVRSGWQGDVGFDEKLWRMSVVDNMDGSINHRDIIILRPNTDTINNNKQSSLSKKDYIKKAIYKAQTSLSYQLPVTRNLFFNGHNFDLAFNFASSDENKKLTVHFTEKHPPLGKLILEGEHIKRLTLEQGNTNEDDVLVILDSPPPEVHIPAGTFIKQKVILETKQSKGQISSECRQKLLISEEKPATLKIGGPLNNSIKISRNGPYLKLDYVLVGNGEEPYHRQVQALPAQFVADRKSPPQFAVYNGDKKIASGSFEYG